MTQPSSRPLVVAAIALAGIALLHAGIALAGPAAYEYFGAPDLAAREARGGPWPDRITWALVGVFALCAYYALAGAGRAPWRPPLLRLGLVAIGAVFTLRGLALGPELVGLLDGAARPPLTPAHGLAGPVPPRYAAFSLVSLAVGVAVLLGLRRSPDAPGGRAGGAAAG